MTRTLFAFPGMDAALAQAKKAFDLGHVPVGAALVQEDKVVFEEHNRAHPIEHAEMNILRLCSRPLDTCDLYVTLQPCTMCAKAIEIMRVRRLYFGAYQRDFRMEGQFFHTQVIGGIYETACQSLLTAFFERKRSVSCC